LLSTLLDCLYDARSPKTMDYIGLLFKLYI
jgi:hypothetical protein